VRARFFILFVALVTLVLARSASAQPDYPSAHWVPPACVKYYSSGNGHKFCVIHDMEGYYEWCVSYLDRCDQNTNGSYNVSASIHYMVNGLQNGTDTVGHSEYTNDVAQGDITQAVLESKYAWHALCLNTYSFGTEHEGFVSNPSWYTEDMYLSSAALQKWLCNRQSIPKDRNHIIGHNEWQNPAWTNWLYTNYPAIDPTCNNHTDPGVYWDWTHFMKLITGEPAISTQPYSQLVDAGTNATFSATVQGSNTMFFQWSKNGVPISGATGSSYTITNVQASNAGSYSLVASNLLGTTTSRTATLTVSPMWVLAFSDDFETNSAARWTLFNSSADYTANWMFDYSAQKYVTNGVTNFIPAAPGGTGTHGIKLTCNKNDATAAASGLSLYPKGFLSSTNYILRFDAWINYCGGPGGTNGSTEFMSCGLNHSATNNNWTGTTKSDGLFFTWDGDGGTGNDDYRAYQGTGAAPTQLSFANSGMSASGATRDHYSDPFFQSLFHSPAYETQGTAGKRWVQVELAYINKNYYLQMNGRLVAQKTNTTSYTNGDAMIGYMDPFSSIAVIPQDNFGIFDNVRVYMQPIPPSITTQPSSQSVIVGTSPVFSAVASGFPLNYQWRWNGANISGATASSYTVTNAQTSNRGTYSVVVSNVVGNVTSANAILAFRPAITTQPQSQTVNPGTSVTFSAAASGDTPLNFQWQKNGSPISGATLTSYNIPSVTSSDGASYSVVVTNGAGTATSSVAVLSVNIPPSIQTQPQSQTASVTGTASFSVVATGTAPLSYQWRFNGTPIGGATKSTYTRSGVTPSDAGSYSVVITNIVTSTNSADAILTVTVSPMRLLTMASNANQIAMSWTVDPGIAYALQYKNTLLDPQWTTLSNYNASTTTLVTTDALDNQQRVYQLLSPQQASESAGYSQVTLLGNSDTLLSVPYTRPGVLLESVGSVSANVITVSGTPAWTPNQFVYSSPTQTNTYFARFVTGALNGKLYPVTANGINTLTLNLGADSLTNAAAGDAIAIEAYWTPATLFPNGAGIFASPTPGNRYTELLIPDTASQGINLSATKVLYFNGGSWKQVGQGTTNHNDDIFAPNSFFIVRHNVATNSTLTTLGSVVSANLAIALQSTTTTQQDNAVALARPVAVSLDDSGLVSSGAFAASPLPGSRTDELQMFDNTVAQKNKSSSAIYYYWSGAWRKVGAGNTDVGSDQVFRPGTGVVIRKATNNAAATWINSPTW
jgi:uncharacterized protein (TIGR02597 family)